MMIHNKLRTLLLIVSIIGVGIALQWLYQMIQTKDFSQLPIIVIFMLLILLLLRITRMRIAIGATSFIYISPLSRAEVAFSDVTALKVESPFPGKGRLEIYSVKQFKGNPLSVSLSMFRFEDLATFVKAVLSANPRVSVDDRVHQILLISD